MFHAAVALDSIARAAQHLQVADVVAVSLNSALAALLPIGAA